MLNVWSYLDEYEAERDDILDAVDTVFRSGQLILGESVRRFEEEFSAYSHVRNGVGVGNGTDAIAIGLRAIGVRPGDEVITVANTAAPTVVAIDAVGARARFVDIDPHTYLMDTAQVAQAVAERTTCILPVHLYGQCADMAAIGAVAANYGLRVLEDCAQAHGAEQLHQRAGSMSHASAFSFYPTKVLGAYGDGGIILTSDDDVLDRARQLRHYGMDDRYFVVTTPAHNSRLDTLQAEILRRKLARLDSYIARRRRLAGRYSELLADTTLALPAVAPGNKHVYYLYVVRHPRRDDVIEAMRDHGVNLNVSYRWPVHTMTGFGNLGYRPEDFPTTMELADQIFSLPMFPSLTDAQQDRVCALLHEVLARID
jgi:dTDP-3-amino-2,3,6-trideoxy-4-keto-D-glucose/dTDP-3-amino-3,4,6-trideoxy-alpha-D-glucose/dTDP-2,6-dideoxy-D-kanosamine transaminase